MILIIIKISEWMAIIGFIMFFIGYLLTFIFNRNVKVPMSGLFEDMPVRVKTGIILIVVGLLLLSCFVLIGTLAYVSAKYKV